MTSDRSQRDLVLGRIRAANAGVATQGATAGEQESVARPAGTGRRTPSHDVVRRFADAAERAGARVSVVPSLEAARECVAAILATVGARQVVLSPDAAAEPWSIGVHLGGIADLCLSVRGAEHAESGRDILRAEVGITAASGGIARTGSLAVAASDVQHRLDSLAPPVHVALVRGREIVAEVGELLRRLRSDRALQRHSAVTLITGPSRTADIELTLTIGVHGPKALHVIVYDDPCDAVPRGAP